MMDIKQQPMSKEVMTKLEPQAARGRPEAGNDCDDRVPPTSSNYYWVSSDKLLNQSVSWELLGVPQGPSGWSRGYFSMTPSSAR